jgi:UDP-N-acetylglucosamine 2-epimerase
MQERSNMESAIILSITTLLQVVQTVLPLVTGATSSTIIISVVAALEKWIPIVTALMPNATTLFQSIKNMIAALSSNPDTPAVQLATLQQLDAQVDTAFEAIALQEDPDAQVTAPVTAPPGAAP